MVWKCLRGRQDVLAPETLRKIFHDLENGLCPSTPEVITVSKSCYTEIQFLFYFSICNVPLFGHREGNLHRGQDDSHATKRNGGGSDG